MDRQTQIQKDRQTDGRKNGEQFFSWKFYAFWQNYLFWLPDNNKNLKPCRTAYPPDHAK